VTPYTVRPLTPTDRPLITPLLVREWGSTEVIALTLGGTVDASTMPGWLAEADGEIVGLLTYLVRDDVAVLVTINSFSGGGVGFTLITALVDECRAIGVKKVLITTTNDNTRALRFYQRAGFRLTALRVDAVTESRKIKPEIPVEGLDGIPIRDEIELSMELP
jgi:ribosomal protein S18 acetylase RimI-like enzyme